MFVHMPTIGKALPRVGLILTVFTLRTYVTSQSVENLALYATKTAYNLSLTTNEREIIQNKDSLLVPSFCQPIHINNIFRHGTRDPSKDDVDSFYDLQHATSGNIENTKFDFLNTWVPQWKQSEADDKSLGPVGEKENLEFGERFGERYSSLLSGASEDELLFYSSSKSRSYNSCKYFQKGYESIYPNVAVVNKTDIRDDRMRFFDYCKKFIQDVDKNPAAKKEFHAFQNGPEMARVAKNVNKLLRLDVPLVPDLVYAAYRTLAYEEAYWGTSVWSDVFTLADRQVLEYYSDIKQWYTKGYAYPINYEQSCPLIQDAFTFIDRAVTADQANTSYVKGLFQFGHAETVLPFLTLLGLYKDKYALDSNNYRVAAHRKFKTSKISPFAANVGMVLYKCDTKKKVSKSDLERKAHSVKWPKKYEKHMVQLIIKESPVAFPFTEYHLTPLSDVKKYYYAEANCDFAEMCALPDSDKDEL